MVLNHIVEIQHATTAEMAQCVEMPPRLDKQFGDIRCDQKKAKELREPCPPFTPV